MFAFMLRHPQYSALLVNLGMEAEIRTIRNGVDFAGLALRARLWWLELFFRGLRTEPHVCLQLF
jgi:hypothetical protein